MNDKNRQIGLDLLRTFAVLFVIASHFMFLNTNFGNSDYEGFDMFALNSVLTLTMTNVPIFLMLTGYLNLNKTVSRKYYLGGIRVIVTYLLISVITILFARYIYSYVSGDSSLEDMSPVQWLLKILDFSAIPYAWYIEMWIGLFLLTPFLNKLWHSLETKRGRQILIATLFLLTAPPDFFNRYGVHLVPGYWELLYPVTFFYMGAYVRTYQPKISRVKLAIAILGICLLNPVVNLFLAHDRPMLRLLGDGNGLFGVPLTGLFFLLLYDIKISSDRICKVLTDISILSLDMYLLSWMCDRIVYPSVTDMLGVGNQWVLMFIICVPAVFILTYVMAHLTYPVSRWMTNIFTKTNKVELSVK